MEPMGEIGTGDLRQKDDLPGQQEENETAHRKAGVQGAPLASNYDKGKNQSFKLPSIKTDQSEIDAVCDVTIFVTVTFFFRLLWFSPLCCRENRGCLFRETSKKKKRILSQEQNRRTIKKPRKTAPNQTKKEAQVRV